MERLTYKLVVQTVFKKGDKLNSNVNKYRGLSVPERAKIETLWTFLILLIRLREILRTQYL